MGESAPLVDPFPQGYFSPSTLFTDASANYNADITALSATGSQRINLLGFYAWIGGTITTVNFDHVYMVIRFGVGPGTEVYRAVHYLAPDSTGYQRTGWIPWRRRGTLGEAAFIRCEPRTGVEGNVNPTVGDTFRAGIQLALQRNP